MAQIEPMDVDTLASDFDDKENSLQNGNVFKSPSTEKGYEELDASEYSLRLRYSITPANSPMSRSYTAKGDSGPNSLNTDTLTRSLNSTITKPDVLKTPKLPLQALPTSQYTNDRSRDREGNIMVTISGANNDDNLSLPSTSSSAVQTPEATTPTKEIPKSEGSPIMRGLKSVLNMFRSSHSPIPPLDDDFNDKNVFTDTMEKDEENSMPKLPDSTLINDDQSNTVLASTPISNSINKDTSKRSSPLKESVVFKEDLERELQWQDDTDIYFKNEKIPVHKLFPSHQSYADAKVKISVLDNDINNLNTTVEYMDVSNADISYKSVKVDTTKNDNECNEMSVIESDNEFLDCETSYTQNKSYILETVQECSKPTPVVFRTDSIPHETCLEDFIEPINEPVVNNDKTFESISPTFVESNKNLPISVEISSLPSENHSNVLDNVPLSSEISLTNGYFVPSTVSNSLCKQNITTDIISELHMKDNVSNSEDIINGNMTESVISLNNLNNTLIESDKTNDTVKEVIGTNVDSDESTSITKTSQPHIQQPIEVNKTSDINVNTNDLDLAFNNNTPNEKCSDNVTSANIRKLSINEMEMKADENLNTDDDNTTRILFNIDSLLLNQANSNCDTDFISNYTDKTTEFNISYSLDTNHSISETKGLDDTVVIAANVTMDTANLNKTIEQVTKQVSDENVRSCVNNALSTTIVNETVVAEDPLLQNITVNNDSDFESNLQKNCEISISLDKKHIIPEDVSSVNVNAVEDVKNIDTNTLSLTNSLDKEHPQDITMDSLEPNEQLPSEIDKNDINFEIGYSCGENGTKEETILQEHIYMQNDLHTNLTLPLDIPLPSDDHNEREKNEMSFNCRIVEPRIISDSSQTQKEFVPNILLDENQDKMRTQCDIDMDDKCSNINHEILSNPLTTNLTKCLQDLNMESIDIQSQQITPDINRHLNNTINNLESNTQQDLNVYIAPTASTLPDVINNVNNAEGADNLNKQEIKTDIVNETLCIEDNVKSNVIDEEIVISANNSPYVSVTDLNSNLTANVEENNPNQKQDETTISPPLSPKCIGKGYNINFDEIEDPFATKTNIRMSPTPEDGLSITFTTVNTTKKNETSIQRKPQNKRWSQPEGKKSDLNKKRFNKSLDRAKTNNNSKTKSNIEKVSEDQSKEVQVKNISEVYLDHIQDNSTFIKNESQYCDDNKNSPNMISEVNKCNETFTEENVIDDNQKLRNVFNIPEIDDIKFNPFATKTRICVTPPPALDTEVPITHKDIEMTTECQSIDQVNTTVCIEDDFKNEVKISANTINSTLSSINTDKDATVREVNTEDEDTVEGPFFEAEDLVELVKSQDTKAVKDSMQFDDIPATINTDIEKGELFIDAEAFEFLLNQNKSNVVTDSGKESLFLKFDPLFAKRVSSEGALAALSSIQKRQSTPKKLTRPQNFTREDPTAPTPGPSNVAPVPEISNAEIVSTISKPMMVVNPAVAKQPVATPRISLTPKTNRQSLNFTSPAMVVIDRLLSLSGNTSLLGDNTPTATDSRNHDANIVLVQLRELLTEKELHVLSLKTESKELRDRLTTLESQVKSLENEGEERLKKVNDLNERLTEKTKINKSMAIVVEEYERTIASLIAEMEQEKKRNAEERIKLINERDEQTVHLTSMECSFSDLHSKYEKCKQIVLSMRANEEAYKKSFKQFDENYQKMQKNYELLKQHATSKLNHANQELEKLNKAHDAEVLKLTAMIKRKDLHITSLEESLAQKNKAIEELTAICDELINKVG